MDKSKIFLSIGLSISAIILLLIWVVFSFLSGYSPMSFIQSSFPLCLQKTVTPNERSLTLKFTDTQTEEPIGCTVIGIYEEDGTCASSPCPRYNPVFKMRTAKDGSMNVPKHFISGEISTLNTVSYDDQIINTDPKYGFDSKEYLHSTLKFSNIISREENGAINIRLNQGDDEEWKDRTWKSLF